MNYNRPFLKVGFTAFLATLLLATLLLPGFGYAQESTSVQLIAPSLKLQPNTPAVISFTLTNTGTTSLTMTVVVTIPQELAIPPDSIAPGNAIISSQSVKWENLPLSLSETFIIPVQVEASLPSQDIQLTYYSIDQSVSRSDGIEIVTEPESGEGPAAEAAAALTEEPPIESAAESTEAPIEEPPAGSATEATAESSESPPAAPAEETVITPTEETTAASGEPPVVAEPTAAPVEESPVAEPSGVPTEEAAAAPVAEPPAAPAEEPESPSSGIPEILTKPLVIGAIVLVVIALIVAMIALVMFALKNNETKKPAQTADISAVNSPDLSASISALPSGGQVSALPASPYLLCGQQPLPLNNLSRETGDWIGRDAGATVRIDHNIPGWESVSGIHARLYRDPAGRVIIQDHQSRNGVWVQNRRTGLNILKNGWKVKIGSVEFVYYDGVGPAGA